jgi:hypothetical protein
MISRLPTVLCMLLGLAPAAVALAAPPAIAQTEINYLLVSMENSTCEFFRNGSWHDAKTAAAHLRDKYEILAREDRIQTAEDFIERAATKSSLSGLPYQVRCSGEAAVTSNEWLRLLLARFRAHAGLKRTTPAGVVRLGSTYPVWTLSRPA